MEIPGFYYDETKSRYFKITSNTAASHRYNSNSIRKEEKENERAAKRAKVDNRQSSRKPTFKLQTFSNLDLKLYGLNTNNRKLDFDQYSLRNIQRRCCTSTRDGYHLEKFQKIVFDSFDDSFLLSSVKSLYEVKSKDLLGEGYKSSYSDLVPILKSTRNDKVNSILRNFFICKQANVSTVIKTWQGVGNEPSEVEAITKSDEGIYQSHQIKFSNRESFNTSLFNHTSNDLVICGSQHCFKQSLSDPNRRDRVILKGIDVLAADYKTANIYLLGTRKGQPLVVDDRVNNKDLHRRKEQQRLTEGSITNIKSLCGERVLCSYIGSTIKLYDIRMGFKNPLVVYNSTKSFEDVFEENLEMMNDTKFMAQTKTSLEIFDVTNPYPIKSMDLSKHGINQSRIRSNATDSCVFSGNFSKNHKSILLTNGEDFDVLN